MFRIICFLVVICFSALSSLSFAAFDQNYNDTYNLKIINDVDTRSKSISRIVNFKSQSIDCIHDHELIFRSSFICKYNHKSFLTTDLYDDFDILNDQKINFQLLSFSGQEVRPKNLIYHEEEGIILSQYSLRNSFFNLSRPRFNFDSERLQKLTSTAPIPAAAWILGVGLISIIGFIRYKKK